MRRDAKEIRIWLSIPFQVRRVQNGTTAGDVNTEGNLSLRVSVHIIISSSHSYINMKWCTFNHLYSRHFRTFDELKRARGIPPIEAFYSTLSKTGISEKEHRHAQEVYLIFGCKSFLSYLELYNRCDSGKTEYHKCIVVNKFINRFLPPPSSSARGRIRGPSCGSLWEAAAGLLLVRKWTVLFARCRSKM